MVFSSIPYTITMCLFVILRTIASVISASTFTSLSTLVRYSRLGAANGLIGGFGGGGGGGSVILGREDGSLSFLPFLPFFPLAAGVFGLAFGAIITIKNNLPDVTVKYLTQLR